MNPLDIIAQDLFDKVRSRFSNLQMGDTSGTVTVDPTQARFFDFDFSIDGDVLGRISISINETGSLKIFYSKGISEQPNEHIIDLWYDFLKEMRFFAKRRLLRFDTRDITKGNLDKNDFQYLAQKNMKDENMNEAAMFGSSKTSHRPLQDTDLIIRHSEAIDPTKAGARSRKIKNLFIQNKEGERFKFPFIYLPGARAMQRHIANGGYPHDEIGQHIVETCEEILKLADFGKKVKSSTLNDNAHHISEKAGLRLQDLRKHMEAMGKQRYYESFCESYAPNSSEPPLLDDAEMESYKDAFTDEQVDESMIQLLHSIMVESSFVDLTTYLTESVEEEHPQEEAKPDDFEFESWANSVIGEGLTDDELAALEPLVQNPLLVGSNDEAIQSLAGIGIRDPELVQALQAVAKMPNGPETDARDIIKSYLGDDAAKIHWGAETQPQPKEQPMGENMGHSKEDFEEWKASVRDRIKSGEIKDWTDLYAELVGDLGVSDDKAEHIARKMMGADMHPVDHSKPAPTHDEHDYSESNMSECPCQDQEAGHEKSPNEEIWKAVEGFLDKDKGTWTKGRPGIIAHISRELGEEAGQKAEKAIMVLSKKYPMIDRESRHQHPELESIRKLAGLSESKPSAGLTKKEKSSIVKKAKAGKDIGKSGKGFAEVEKAAKKGGATDPKAVAAAAMWKNVKR